MSDELLQDIKSKYNFYVEVMKKNRVDNYYVKHDCGADTHTKCLRDWAHSSILIECVGRLYWCFTGYQPVYCNLKIRPELGGVMYYIFNNRPDLDNKEYEWLMAVKDKLKLLYPPAVKKQTKKTRSQAEHDETQTIDEN